LDTSAGGEAACPAKTTGRGTCKCVISLEEEITYQEMFEE
jgi:hypothetical protein